MVNLEEPEPFRVGVLASGGGTNLQAILDRCASGEIPARVAVVVGNNSKSRAMKRAADAGVVTAHLSAYTHPDPVLLDRAIAGVLCEHQVDLVVLAGFMKKLGPITLTKYANRILNIHPALLPAFGGQGMYGQRVHEAVLKSGARITGVTVHLVDAEYDQGPIVAQEITHVYQDDTPESLAARVLQVEHKVYAEVIRWFATGKVSVVGRRVYIEGVA